MKAGLIFARKTTWRSRLDLEYLDETSSRKISARQQKDDGPKRIRPLRQFADYASKETLGQVHAGGFLHHLILINEDGSRTAPSQLTNDERKRRISEAWFEHIRKYPTSSKNPVVQHRLVFSMSRKLHDKLVEAGINPDRVLQSTTKKVMGKFNERFHPADSIGYAYGIHHDTDNLHIHVALCPRTARGAYVGCSTARNPASGHKDQMKYLRSCFERENKRWEQILASPQKMEEHLSRRLDSDKIVFSPRLNPSQIDALRNAQTTEAIRLQQLYSTIRNLEASITAKRKYFALKRSANFVSRLVGRRAPKAARAAEKLADAVDRRSLREMRHSSFQDQGAIQRRPQTVRADAGIQLLCQSSRHRPSATKRTLSSFSARDSPSDLPTWTVSRTRSTRMVPQSPSSISSPTRRRSRTRSEGCSISSSANSNQGAPMKASDLLIYILGIAGALAGYFVLQPPLSWAAVGICAVFAVWTLFAVDAAAKPVLRLAGLSWSMEDFVRGWLITGTHWIRQDTMRDQYHHVSDFSERPALGRRLPRPEGTLLGNPREDGRALRARRRPRLAANPASRKR